MIKVSPIYAIHPGITYLKLGEMIRLNYNELISLYKLQPKHCVLWDDRRPPKNLSWENFIHLGPKRDGNYELGNRMLLKKGEFFIKIESDKGIQLSFDFVE